MHIVTSGSRGLHALRLIVHGAWEARSAADLLCDCAEDSSFLIAHAQLRKAQGEHRSRDGSDSTRFDASSHRRIPSLLASVAAFVDVAYRSGPIGLNPRPHKFVNARTNQKYTSSRLYRSSIAQN